MDELDNVIKDGRGNDQVIFVHYNSSKIAHDPVAKKDYYKPINTTFVELRERFDEFTGQYFGSSEALPDSVSGGAQDKPQRERVRKLP